MSSISTIKFIPALCSPTTWCCSTKFVYAPLGGLPFVAPLLTEFSNLSNNVDTYLFFCILHTSSSAFRFTVLIILAMASAKKAAEAAEHILQAEKL